MSGLSNFGWRITDFDVFNAFGYTQYAQHDSVRMEDEDGSPMPGRIAGVEDGHRLFLRPEHLNGNQRLISTSELTPPSSHATAVGEEREIRIPRRRPRVPPSRWKGGVSFSLPVPNNKIIQFLMCDLIA